MSANTGDQARYPASAAVHSTRSLDALTISDLFSSPGPLPWHREAQVPGCRFTLPARRSPMPAPSGACYDPAKDLCQDLLDMPLCATPTPFEALRSSIEHAHACLRVHAVVKQPCLFSQCPLCLLCTCS